MAALTGAGAEARQRLGLQHHHRLHSRGGARGRHELARRADTAQLQRDRARLRIERGLVEQVGDVDVGLAAGHRQPRQADVAPHRPVHRSGGNRLRLCDQRDIAGMRRQRQRGQVVAEPRHAAAAAARAKQAHRGWAHRLQQGGRRFGGHRPQQRATSRVGESPDRLRRGMAAIHHHREIGRRPARLLRHHIPTGLGGAHQRSTRGGQRVREVVMQLLRAVAARRAQHQHMLGREQRAQVADGHKAPPRKGCRKDSTLRASAGTS